jgi:vesicle coat complex subunit
MNISEKNTSFTFAIDTTTANRLLSILEECSEWQQSFVIESLMTLKDIIPIDAELLIERLSPRLSHSNSGIVIQCVRVIFHLSNHSQTPEFIEKWQLKCGPPMGI